MIIKYIYKNSEKGIYPFFFFDLFTYLLTHLQASFSNNQMYFFFY